jgi:hypothetical protein
MVLVVSILNHVSLTGAACGSDDPKNGTGVTSTGGVDGSGFECSRI